MKRIAALLALLLSFAVATVAPNRIAVDVAHAGNMTLLGAGSSRSFNPGTFSVCGTLSGLEISFPSAPLPSEISYLDQKDLNCFRLPLGWGGSNALLGGPIGIQPTPDGPLDTTSGYLNSPLFGNNIAYQSQALATSPWSTFSNASGSTSRTNNAGIAPDGSNTATLIQVSRSSLSDFAELFQSFIGSAPAVTTPFSQGVWLKASTPADIGKVITLAFNNANINNVGVVDVALTSTWTLYQSTGNIDPGGSKYEFDIGLLGPVSTSGNSTGSINFLAWGFQANPGSSLLPYTATSGGYLQAVDNLVNQAASLGMDVILDIHDFGNGPGPAGAFAITSLTASGNVVTATTPAATTLANGVTVTISGAQPTSYDGQFVISNVTTNTFQYTTTIPPPSSPATHPAGSIFGGENAVVGTSRLPVSSFANLWGQISAHYKGNTGIRGYDLMNEWVNGFDSSTVFAANQAAINAIRANGDTAPIYVEGTNFSGAWNWVSGEGQSFNNANLYQLTDSANNLIFSAHGYPDRDCSGTHYVYSQESTTAGACPPPTSTNPTIQVTRYTPFVQWCAQHQVRCHIGEGAVASNDPIFLGGVSNYPAWNLVLQNNLTFAQENNLEVAIWGAGTIFGPSTPYAGYPFNYEPSSTSSPTQKDFSSTGLQSTQMVVLDKFTGYSGPQPLAYAISLPVDGSFNPIRYGSIGVASGNFTVSYNAKIVAPVTITPNALLMDGTDGGGTFTPASIVLAAGDNATATFTYTPNQSATFRIGATNNRGLIDPPRLGYASSTDTFAGSNATNVYGMLRLVAPYTGPAYRFQRVSDGAQQDFFFNNRGDLPRQAIQDFLNSRTGIPVIEYDQSGAGNNKVPCQVSNGSCVPSLANPPTFTLVNSAGYPEKTITSGQFMVAQSPSSGQGLQSILIRAKTATPGALISQDIFNGQFRVTGTDSYSVSANGSPITTVSMGTNTGSFASVAGTFSNLYSTNNVNGYQNGTLHASSSSAPFTFQPFNGATETDYYGFRFGGSNYVGSEYYDAITYTELSSATIAARAAADATYYSTPLPDALSALNPTIAGATNQQTVSGLATLPFSSIVIGDGNNPSPTDSITITLSGFPATLAGTGLSGSGPYTIAAASPASVTATLQAVTLTATGATGSVTNINIAVSSSFGTSANTNITDTISSASVPVIAGMVAPNVSKDQGAPALWQVAVTDSTPSARDSATITISGSGGALSHFGPYAPGGGPTVYTFSAMTPTELTRALRNLIWAPTTSTVGTTTTFALQITNNAGLTASASNTITNIAPQAMPTAFTPVATPAALPPNYNGLNLSGGENTPTPNYAVLNSAGFAWALSKSFTTIRAPFKMYFMVQTANTPPAGYQFYEQFYANFHAADIAALHSAVETARSNGQYIILDDHSQAGIGNPFPLLTQDDPAPPSLPFLIWGADPRVPVSAFGDMWQRMTAYFQNYPNVLMGLQNEPGIGGTPWFNMEVAGANGVRAVSSTVPYLISGNNSNVTQFDFTPFTGYVDPAGGPFFFDVHMYFDPGHQGTGNTCLSNTIASYFSTFTTWLNANSYRAFVSEFAWGTDITCEPTFGTSVVAYFNTNSNVYPGWQWWGGGDFGTSYPYYMGPIGSPPQYPLLAPYLP